MVNSDSEETLHEVPRGYMVPPEQPRASTNPQPETETEDVEVEEPEEPNEPNEKKTKREKSQKSHPEQQSRVWLDTATPWGQSQPKVPPPSPEESQPSQPQIRHQPTPRLFVQEC